MSPKEAPPQQSDRRSPAQNGTVWWQRFQVLFWGAIFVIGASLALALQFPLNGQVVLSVGDVSPTDIRSPRQITYESKVLTERARERAAAAVPDVFDPPEARVRREQLARAREVLDFIDSVRHDDYASLEQRVAWISAIPDVQLSRDIIEQMLSLDDASWRRVANEVQIVLDRIMREEIRENQLELYQRRVPSLVSLDLTDEEAAVTTALVRALMRPNSFFNPERTEAEREAARKRVPPQMRTLEAGEIILRAGDIVTPEHIEALEALGLRQPRPSRIEILRAVLFVLIIATVLGVYLYRLAPTFWAERQWPPLLATLLLSFIVLARAMVPGEGLLPFIFPMAAMAMLLAALLDLRVAILATIGLALIVNYLADGSAALITYLLTGSLIGMFTLGRGERLSAFVWAGASVAAANLAVLLTFKGINSPIDTAILTPIVAVAIVNGGLSASLTLISLYLLGSLFGIVTSLQLMELSRPTHPLLRQLLLKAPGTYHHTILVSNLGERAAEAVGADPLLTRVGAYYHDIGKTLRPYFFVENLAEGTNPHDRLDPYTSAKVIISHVKDGLDMARKHRLPSRVRAFIPEHHGTTLVTYFYRKAQEQAGEGEEIDKEAFRYPGPRPQSKETAIIMLADACESAVRAERPASREEIDQIVARIIHNRLMEGQLDESDLTLKDLHLIRQTFVRILQGIHHPRIQYPEPVQVAQEVTEPATVGARREMEPSPEPRQARPSPPPNGNRRPGDGVG
ncbi:MAG TPA: HDIG domain-containing protein [Caldilineae bacterium]|nr:HDIG domain-containing protein [Caldilineae bacterium]